MHSPTRKSTGEGIDERSGLLSNLSDSVSDQKWLLPFCPWKLTKQEKPEINTPPILLWRVVSVFRHFWLRQQLGTSSNNNRRLLKQRITDTEARWKPLSPWYVLVHNVWAVSAEPIGSVYLQQVPAPVTPPRGIEERQKVLRLCFSVGNTL